MYIYLRLQPLVFIESNFGISYIYCGYYPNIQEMLARPFICRKQPGAILRYNAPAMLNIEDSKDYRVSFLHLGFRPFFLLATVFATIAMALWVWLYHFNQLLPASPQLVGSAWHAHEMIYGYALAVIAGFLLTAIKNWTGVQTLNGIPLLLLALIWLLARVMPFVNHPLALTMMLLLDVGFNIALCLALVYPIIRAGQWMQMGVWSKVVLLAVFNVLFYLGLLGELASGVQWGLYGGLYIIVSLILMMARRVIPFFIEKGVDEPFMPVNRKWVDISSLVLLVAFLILEVFLPYPLMTAGVSLLLFVVHCVRISGWYTPGIRHKPLLWILYLAYGWMIIGFGMKALEPFVALNPMLALHAFALGGIGLMTIGMMARVALGHTGRSVFEPPTILTWIFAFMVTGSLLRVGLPLFLPQFYTLWVGLSQFAWITGFGLFAGVYAPMLYLPRIDGRYG